jgi:hypothetical protein
MPPSNDFGEQRFDCIEVTGIDADPEASHHPPEHWKVPGSPARADRPKYRGFDAKRLIGFEPTTFCMAIRPTPSPDWRQICSFAGTS